ncbi:MAG: RecX family transcriptional regulator [Bryobacteraceae bacterium]
MQPRKTVRKLAAEELFEYAVRYLGLRACSTDELKSRLRARAALVADVDAAIVRLKDIGYLDDRRFAESYAAARLENDGFGRMRVLTDLRSRRVPANLAEKAVERVFEDKSENDLIDAFIERRLPSLVGAGQIEDERILARAYRRLRRAGFSSAGTLAALKRMAARPELIDEPPPDDPDAEAAE